MKKSYLKATTQRATPFNSIPQDRIDFIQNKVRE